MAFHCEKIKYMRGRYKSVGLHIIYYLLVLTYNNEKKIFDLFILMAISLLIYKILIQKFILIYQQ